MPRLPFISLFFEAPDERDVNQSESSHLERARSWRQLGTETFTKARGESGDTDISESGSLWETKII